MPQKQINREEIYEVVDGISTLIEVKETEIDVPTIEEEIADKEAKMLEMYAELQALKEKQTN